MESRAERGSKYGNIDVIYGPMFSGKSDELIRILGIAERHGREIVQAFYPHVDNRGKPGTINTADGEEFPATEVFSSREIVEKLKPGVTLVGIDEAQFMDMKLPEVCIEIAAMGKKVIVAGLATDFKYEVFGPMGGILAIADFHTKMRARCGECGDWADRTQRFVRKEDGTIRPARRDEDVVVVGGKEDDLREKKNEEGKKKAVSIYDARCHNHHIVGDPLE